MRRFVVMLVCAACSSHHETPAPKPPPPPPADPMPPGIALAPDGLYFARDKLGTLADLETVRPRLLERLTAARAQLPAGQAGRNKMTVVVQSDPSIRAAMVSSVIGVVTLAGWDKLDLDTVDDGHLHMVCAASSVPPPDAAPNAEIDETLRLSIYVQADQIWVGLSRVEDYQQILNVANRSDLDKLEITLEEDKASPFFRERTDAQLAADPDVPASALLAAAEVACRAGFTDTTIVPPEQLAARPDLDLLPARVQ